MTILELGVSETMLKIVSPQECGVISGLLMRNALSLSYTQSENGYETDVGVLHQDNPPVRCLWTIQLSSELSAFTVSYLERVTGCHAQDPCPKNW